MASIHGIVLVGGFGNNLFQLNYHFYKRSLLPSACPNTFFLFDSFLTLIFRRFRGVSSYEIHPLVFKILPNAHISRLRLFNVLFLSISRLISKRFFGHLWIDQSYSGFNYDRCLIVRSYFMCDIPVSKLLVSRIRSVLEIGDSLAPRICTHMRFNDSSFKSLPFFYYDKSVKYALSFDARLPVYIVSNDKSKAAQFARSIDTKQVVEIVSGSIEDDFSFMAQSQILICSNSTFSWWASECSCNAQTIISPHYSTYSNYKFSPLSKKRRLVMS